MSDINLDFTVSNNSIDFTVQPNDITITPTDIQLSFYNGGAPLARGANMEVQYNNEGILEGDPNFTFDQDVGLLSISNINTGGLQATGNVSIGGYIGSNVNIEADTFLAANMVATTANIQNGTINANAITSIHSNLGNVGNVKIGGGTNGYILQTDGTGNLSWSASGGGGGNGSPGGSNTQIQYNDAGVFGGNAGFTFNEISGNVAIPGNLSVVGNITGNVQTAYLANFANVSNSVAGANVTGTVANANYAAFAGNITISNQPNITSIGTLSALNVAGTTSIQQAKEKFTPNATGATGTINFDLLTSAIINNTSNATANFTLNFRGNSTTTLASIVNSNESITCSFLNTNGVTAYVPTSITVDGSAPTLLLWAGNTGSPGVGTSNGKDLYTFNILKSAANTFTVLSSRVGFV
jgi:hypothetical protein